MKIKKTVESVTPGDSRSMTLPLDGTFLEWVNDYLNYGRPFSGRVKACESYLSVTMEGGTVVTYQPVNK